MNNYLPFNTEDLIREVKRIESLLIEVKHGKRESDIPAGEIDRWVRLLRKGEHHPTC